VTRGATDPFINVNTVLEVNEIRQIVDPRPLNRPARAKAVAHRFQNRAFGPNLRVAIHADFRAGDSRKGLGLDRSVAIAAIDPIIAHVMLMAELNRLGASDVSLGGIGRPIDLSHDPDDPGEDEDCSENTELGKGIGAGMKNLGHGGNRFDKCERAAAYHTDKHLRECRTRVRLWVFAPQRLNELPGSPLSREIPWLPFIPPLYHLKIVRNDRTFPNARLPCIRGLRIPVSTVVEMVADRMPESEILKTYPDLERGDIHQALQYMAADTRR
jgi:Protein of unknown function (DUF433)